jgi:hypothetical protein
MVQLPTGSRDFSFRYHIQTGSEGHPPSCAVSTRCCCQGVRTRNEAGHLHPSSAKVEKDRSYTSSLPYNLMVCLVNTRNNFTLILQVIPQTSVHFNNAFRPIMQQNLFSISFFKLLYLEYY